MNWNIWTTVILVVLLALAGCAGNPVAETKAWEAGPPVKVKLESVQTGESRRTFEASGTVHSLVQAPLASKVMGTILEIRVRPGDPVKAGQVLAVIDSREVESMVEKAQSGIQEVQSTREEVEKGLLAAEANLELATATLKRYQELKEKKSVSPQEFEEVQARQRVATAQVDALEAKKQQVLAKAAQIRSDMGAAQVLKSYSEIRSPLNGDVSLRQAEPGSLAVPGVPLLTVEEIGRFRLEVPVEESRIARIRLGEEVRVKIDSVGREGISGVVGEIQPSADTASRTYLVKINLPALPGLRAGMYGEASFLAGTRQGIWLNPRSVVRQGQLEGVYVVDKENTARLRLLRLGESSADGVEVLSGLQDGERYVTEGPPELKDGSRVEVVR